MIKHVEFLTSKRTVQSWACCEMRPFNLQRGQILTDLNLTSLACCDNTESTFSYTVYVCELTGL